MDKLLASVPCFRTPSCSSVKGGEAAIALLSISFPPTGNLSLTSLPLGVKKRRKGTICGRSPWCVVWQSDMLMFPSLGSS